MHASQRKCAHANEIARISKADQPHTHVYEVVRMPEDESAIRHATVILSLHQISDSLEQVQQERSQGEGDVHV